jgi:GH24 family phage-related lysozyme (muramidase)
MTLQYYTNWKNAHEARKTRGFSEGGFVSATGAKLPTTDDISMGAKGRIDSLMKKRDSKRLTKEMQKIAKESVGQQYMNAFADENEQYLTAGLETVTRDPNIKVPSSALSEEALQDEMVAMLSSGDTKRDNKGLDVRATKAEPLKDFIFNFIAGKEDFKSTPYDDSKKGSKKPVWRAGFGSDTYTQKDGTVITVKQNSFVSKEDAIRDLNRRLETEFIPRVKRSVGANTWNTLGDSTKTALTSYIYNYGNIGESIIKAANSGSTRKLADAVRARAVDNNGLNSSRRNDEADLIESDMTGPELIAKTRERNK